MTAPVNTNICVSYGSRNRHQYLCLYDCHTILIKTQIFVFRMSTYTRICVLYGCHNKNQYLCLYDCHTVLMKTQIFVFRMSTYTRICVLYGSHNKLQYLSLQSINRFVSIIKVMCHAGTATL